VGEAGYLLVVFLKVRLLVEACFAFYASFYSADLF
jgi:hypothetical protein